MCYAGSKNDSANNLTINRYDEKGIVTGSHVGPGDANQALTESHEVSFSNN